MRLVSHDRVKRVSEEGHRTELLQIPQELAASLQCTDPQDRRFALTICRKQDVPVFTDCQGKGLHILDSS
jgi:hypothetical protein